MTRQETAIFVGIALLGSATMPLIGWLLPRGVSQKTFAGPPSSEISPEIPRLALAKSTAQKTRQEHAIYSGERLSFVNPLENASETKMVIPESDTELESLANSITEPDIPGWLDFLSKRTDSESASKLLGKLVHRWAALDATDTAAWVDGQPAGALRQEAANSLGIVWANTDLSGAENWITQWPEGKERDEVVTNIAYEVARQNPKEAIDLVNALLPEQAANDLAIHAAFQWAAQAPQDAANWAGQIQDTALRDRFLANVVTAWADADPKSAAAFAATKLASGRAQDDAVVGIVQRWVQTDPLATARWVSGFPTGSLRDNVVQNMVSIWSEKAPSSLVEWLNQLPAGSLRDVVTAAYVEKLCATSPDLAKSWALGIQDTTVRNACLKGIFGVNIVK